MEPYFLNAAIQASHSKEEIHNNCLSCGGFIKSPICPNCISIGFKQWLQVIPNEEKAINKRVDHFLNRHKHLEENSIRCISCNKRSTHTCPYCFTDFLYKVTKEAGAGVRHLTEFLFIFNFDFRHLGYSQELEAMGGY
jgi:hypothetical protein